MNRFANSVAWWSVFTASIFLSFSGCSGPSVEEKGPSYAELVTIYNAELQTLDRLERKREELVTKHGASLGPSAADATKAIDALLSSASEAGKSLDLKGVTDSNELLDRAVEHAEKTQGIANELLKSVSSAAEPTEEEVQKQAKLTQQFERDLATLDKQITEQKVRVERAQKARDTAEAARK